MCIDDFLLACYILWVSWVNQGYRVREVAVLTPLVRPTYNQLAQKSYTCNQVETLIWRTKDDVQVTA